MDELKDRLSRMDGSSTPVEPGSSSDSSVSDLYPPICQLPLVGVKWVDLYRQAKLQETLFELLTQQYELAKIEEAKEIPTVKILDRANVPERKSFPPRTVIVILGTLFSLVVGVLVVVGSARWRESDPHSPKKQFVTEIWDHLRQTVVSTIGHDRRCVKERFWGRAGKQNTLPE